MTPRTISPAGVALIQDFEGFLPAPHSLPQGGWAIGYGHVRAEAGEVLSEAEAVHLLAGDLAFVEREVNELVTQPLTQTQFDALVSFAFSIGVDAFAQSQVLRRLNAGQFVAAACAMDAWRKSEVDGALEVVDALVLRRTAEKALFLKDMLQAAPSALLRARLDYAASVLGAPTKDAATRPQVSAVKGPRSSLQDDLAQPGSDTSPLLLTQVMTDETDLVTEAANPVERVTEVHVELPIDRRIRNQRQSATAGAPLETNALAWSHETLGSAALLLLGLAMIALGAAILADGGSNAFSLPGAMLLGAIGIGAAVLAVLNFLRDLQSVSA